MSRYAITYGQRVTSEKLSFAKRMRRKMTPAEKVFWEHVRGRRYAGLRFRRQQVIDGFIADFYCSKLKVVIEIDGAFHEQQKEYDSMRDKVLEAHDIKVKRFSNEAVLNDLDTVMSEIFSATLGKNDH